MDDVARELEKINETLQKILEEMQKSRQLSINPRWPLRSENK